MAALAQVTPMTGMLSNPWTKVNLALAITFILLVLIDRQPSDTASNQPLTSLSVNDIADIRIERGQRLTLHLQRTQDGWALRYPNDAKAKPQRVQQLLAIALAPVQRTLPVSQTLEEYGLDPPSAIAQFDRLRLAFGTRDPSQRNRYVLVNDEIRLIDDVYFNLLTLPARHFLGD